MGQSVPVVPEWRCFEGSVAIRIRAIHGPAADDGFAQWIPRKGPIFEHSQHQGMRLTLAMFDCLATTNESGKNDSYGKRCETVSKVGVFLRRFVD